MAFDPLIVRLTESHPVFPGAVGVQVERAPDWTRFIFVFVPEVGTSTLALQSELRYGPWSSEIRASKLYAWTEQYKTP